MVVDLNVENFHNWAAKDLGDLDNCNNAMK